MPDGDADARRRAEIRAAIQAQIDEVNETLARVEQVKKFTILPRPFGIDTGELTPTLKIKRKVVAQKYAREIEAMYAGRRRGELSGRALAARAATSPAAARREIALIALSSAKLPDPLPVSRARHGMPDDGDGADVGGARRARSRRRSGVVRRAGARAVRRADRDRTSARAPRPPRSPPSTRT